MYKATAVMGFATFVTMMAGLVKAKFLAVLLGPLGVGIYSQAVTFFQSADMICGLGIVFGITKYVSEMRQARNISGVRKVITASVFLQSISFLIFFILVFIFSKQISLFVFSSTEYSWLLILASVAVLFSTFLSSLEATLLGLARPDAHSKSRIIYNIIGAALLVLIIGAMKVKGGFLYIVINSLMSLLIVCVFLTRILKSEMKITVKEIIKPDEKVGFKTYTSKLFSYGATMLVTSSVSWLTILYTRSLLIRQEGTVANGLYQVVFALVGYYTPFFTNSVWGYFFPKLSAINDGLVFNIEVNKMLRFVLLFLTPSIAVLFLLKKTIVVLIFSKEFLGSLEIFPIYLAGSLFFMLSYILGATFLAKRQLAAYFAIILCQNILYVLLFTGLVDRFGLLAIAISYCAANLIGCFLCVSYQMWRTRLKIDAGNLRLFLLSIGFIIIIFFMPSKTILYEFLKWALLILWAIFVIGKREKALLLLFIKGR